MAGHATPGAARLTCVRDSPAGSARRRPARGLPGPLRRHFVATGHSAAPRPQFRPRDFPAPTDFCVKKPGFVSPVRPAGIELLIPDSFRCPNLVARRRMAGIRQKVVDDTDSCGRVAECATSRASHVVPNVGKTCGKSPLRCFRRRGFRSVSRVFSLADGANSNTIRFVWWHFGPISGSSRPISAGRGLGSTNQK